jgi:hypothetical protein
MGIFKELLGLISDGPKKERKKERKRERERKKGGKKERK